MKSIDNMERNEIIKNLKLFVKSLDESSIKIKKTIKLLEKGKHGVQKKA